MKKDIAKILNEGGVGVFLTDTLYGVLGSAFSKKAVLKVYEVKKRDLKKPMIILISSFSDLEKFGVKISKKEKEVLKSVWPGKVSVLLPCKLKKYEYLHRGTNSLAFRMPKKKSLLELLLKTGPLVAPSANPEGLLSAKNIKEAKKYFKDEVDFYEGSGKPSEEPSALIELKNNKAKVIRGDISKLKIKK